MFLSWNQRLVYLKPEMLPRLPQVKINYCREDGSPICCISFLFLPIFVNEPGKSSETFFISYARTGNMLTMLDFIHFRDFFSSWLAFFRRTNVGWKSCLLPSCLCTLCQLLVVLISLFRVVWDFLVGCLGFFTEGSCSLFYPLIAWVCATRCFSLFTCQRFKGRRGLLHTFHRGGS